MKSPNRLGRVFIYVVDESPLWIWIVSFAAILVGFAILYAVLSPIGHGILDGNKPIKPWELGLAIYFSAVTISSLGYGDIHPEGVARVFATLEVLLGLSIMGIVIAKITSKPLSHLVSRLFVSETKRQLAHFKIQFDARRVALADLLEVVNHVYQQTPAQTPGEPAEHTPGRPPGRPPGAAADLGLVEQSLRTSVGGLLESSSELYDYIQAEGLHRGYFALAPTTSFLQLAEAVEDALYFLAQSVVSLPVSSHPAILNDVLTYTNRRALDAVLSKQQATCETIVTGVRADEEVQVAFRRITNLCASISGLLLPGWEQPDQLIQAS